MSDVQPDRKCVCFWYGDRHGSGCEGERAQMLALIHQLMAALEDVENGAIFESREQGEKVEAALAAARKAGLE